MQIVGQKVLIVGLARSGAAAAEFLSRRGAQVIINDAKPEDELINAERLRAHGIEIVAGSHPVEMFKNAELIVTSPGVPLTLEGFKKARMLGVPVISEVELASRFLRGRLIGITGSNGKTTTTTLIANMLEDAGFVTQIGGNIGTPLISLVETSRDDGFTVIELSSFQLEAIQRLRLSVAVLLNITPDHLDRYESMDDYAAAKAKVFCNQTEEDFAVLNADDVRVAEMGSMTAARRIFFSRRYEPDEGLFLRGNVVVGRYAGREEIMVSREEIPLRGDHNLENIMAALGAGIVCGVPSESMRATIRAFSGVEHRLEFAGEIAGVKFYNDSKATNVDAAIKSLEAFAEGVIVLLGGKDKGGDYRPLAPLIQKRCRHVILIGAAADKIAAALTNTRPLHRAGTMTEAVELGFGLSEPGNIVLLAPACASFDMFENFEHRGRVFKEAVKGIKAKFKI
jgi:UDP-N-acetylmuramoylalanine--D-glutamate ligase